MTLKKFWTGTGKWLRSHKPFTGSGPQPEIDENGLISQGDDPPAPENEAPPSNEAEGDQVMVKAVPPVDRQESLEKLQMGFDKLVEQLQGINEHLNRQATQHEDLMNRIRQLPQVLESFPDAVENQKHVIEQLLEQLKGASAKNEQFMDAVGKIPTETAKQTDALVKIDQQLAAAANIDVQMSQSFNNFNETLEQLNQTSMGQTDGILQMSKTFAASDRYLKYIISKHSKRFMWIFIAAISVCTVCILILTGIIIYLNR
jgi:ABC-type transporter Mla subunit MlaD